MIYIFFFLLSFGLTYIIKQHAIKNSLVAEITERSSHTVPTPHGGGIAIVITWFAGLTYLFYNDTIEHSLYYALMTGVIISVVSYLDDLFELSAKIRLITQSIVAITGLYFLGGFETLDLFFLQIDNQIITNVFAFLMIIWFINLYNFLDGIDGYAGSEAIFLAIAGFLLFGDNHFIVLSVSVLGFLIWNWHKAKIFMGDVGSTLLGYNIAIFTLYYANQEAMNFWTWIILFGLFWFDATLTLLRRYRNKEKLSQAHKKHAYQRLNQSGWAHDKVVKTSILVNGILLGIVYISINNLPLGLLTAFGLLYTIVKTIDRITLKNE
ncbi:MAG: glycosyl transferase [Sulfurovum sp.]|nr:MAG: glycosyl transferase [Sulfurovum sp.]